MKKLTEYKDFPNGQGTRLVWEFHEGTHFITQDSWSLDTEDGLEAAHAYGERLLQIFTDNKELDYDEED